MSIVFFLAKATINFFLTFLSVSLEFLFAEIWKVERRRAVEKIRLGAGTSASGIFREINCDYRSVCHPFGNDLLFKGRLFSSLQCSSCKKYEETRIIEKEKTGHEVESDLLEAEEDFCAVFEDLFEDSYAEVSYVISPKKWPRPKRCEIALKSCDVPGYVDGMRDATCGIKFVRRSLCPHHRAGYGIQGDNRQVIRNLICSKSG